MVATSSCRAPVASTAMFNDKGLSAVDAYFGVVDDQEEVSGTAPLNNDGPRTEEKKTTTVSSFLKSNLKRRRRDDIEETYEKELSDEEEEGGRTCIVNNNEANKKTGKQVGNAVLEPTVEANNKPDKKQQQKLSQPVKISKEDSDEQVVDTVPRSRAKRKKKSRSRQKNIRKDNRDVKPSFTRDPTAPGYCPLTQETREFLRNKATKKSFSPLISKLNKESS